MSVLPPTSGEIQSQYRRIGGWLILVTIGLCLSPLLQIAFIVTNLVPIFRTGTWALLTTRASAAYHPLWAPLIIFELLMNVGFIAAEAALLFWLFRRSRVFPKAMIAYLLMAFVLVAIDYFLAQAIPAIAAQNDPQSRLAFVRSGALCAIWVPYFGRSRRVKGTFVN